MTIDIIGTIHRPTGTTLTNSDGDEYPEYVPIPGHHINSTEPVPEWEQYQVFPSGTYHCVFAGVETFCYRFDSAEQAHELAPHLFPELEDAE